MCSPFPTRNLLLIRQQTSMIGVPHNRVWTAEVKILGFWWATVATMVSMTWG